MAEPLISIPVPMPAGHAGALQSAICGLVLVDGAVVAARNSWGSFAAAGETAELWGVGLSTPDDLYAVGTTLYGLDGPCAIAGDEFSLVCLSRTVIEPDIGLPRTNFVSLC